jgi:adenylate kinase
MSDGSEAGGQQLILLFGGPGAGKGTQSRLLSASLGVPHISSGDLLRAQHEELAQSLMKRGDLVPDDVVDDLVFARLQQPDAQRGAILDGFPRTLNQALALDRWVDEQGSSIRQAVYLDVPRDELVKRLLSRGESSGRSDDQATAAVRRLDVFLNDLPPVLDHYAGHGKLRNVDGSQSIDEVHRQVLDALN